MIAAGETAPKHKARRWALVADWALLLSAVGLDASEAIRRAGLSEELLGRERPTLTTEDYYRLWSTLEALGGGMAIGIALCEHMSAESLDPPIFAALCSPDLNAALLRLADFKPLTCPIRIFVDIGDAFTEVEVAFEDQGPAPSSLILTELAFCLGIARLGTRERIVPLSIEAPVGHDEDAVKRHFGVEMKPSRSARIRFSSADAAKRFVTTNAAMWSILEPELRERLRRVEASSDVRDRVESALLELLPAGQSSLAAVADRLRTSVRTLQRRLAAAGHSYQDVLNETRRRLAVQYLETTPMSATEIAFLLGYYDPNSFFRAFRAWTGTTPDAIRSRSGA